MIIADWENTPNFKEIFSKLISLGFLERDSQIDFNYLVNKTKKRISFPDVLFNGVHLHPLTFVYTKRGSPRIMSTNKFIADPLGAINY